MTLWEEIVDAINAINGAHPGHRAIHAKGTFCSGSFRATEDAARICRAPHMSGEPVAATVRFSNASGNPRTPDLHPLAGRGMAVKFHLGGDEATDLVMAALPVFMVRTPEDFLEFTRARRPDPETGQPDPERFSAFLAQHPETAAALQLALPSIAPTTSFATSAYNALHAFRLTGPDGERTWGRWSWLPEAGVEPMPPERAEGASRDYLQEEIRERLADGPVGFRLELTLAEDGDPLDDPTALWPEGRRTVEMGRLEVAGAIDDPERPGEPLVFDPMRLSEGIEPSDDPVLAARPHAYAVSVERRSAAF